MPIEPRNFVERFFRPALKRAGLRRIRWHDLRHTYASLQLDAGANIKYLSAQMGHASVQITLDRYAKLMKDTHPVQAARLSESVFGLRPSAAVLPGEQQSAGTTRQEEERQPGHEVPQPLNNTEQ